MESLKAEARKMFCSDYAKECTENGRLVPTVNRNPIAPPLLSIEYDSMEKDCAKYFLYYSAIYVALKQWKVRVNKSELCHIMVIGGGRGRLVEYCSDCLSDLGMQGFVFVVEVNQEAYHILNERFAQNKHIHILKPFALRTAFEMQLAKDMNVFDSKIQALIDTKPIHLFVSELFGSFADNEFVSEILCASIQTFGKKDASGKYVCTSIPESYTTYICGIHSDTLQKFFQNHNQEKLYILQVPEDAQMLSNITMLYTASCYKSSEELISNITLQKTNQVKPLTGIAGYFEATLYGDICIHTAPTPKQNTYFWETAFFPVLEDSSSLWRNQGTSINCFFARKCKQIKPDVNKIFDINSPVLHMWYEWGLGDVPCKHNGGGVHHSLHL